MTSQHALVCNDLFYIYPDGTEALKDVTLRLDRGKIHVIIGPNGAGKTTFLRIATTEFLPTKGSLSILGHDIRGNREIITRTIGVMPQQALLYKQLTPWEHVYYLTLLRGFSHKESKRETERVLWLLDLYDCRHVEINSLSGGIANSVNLAQALAGDSEMVFLDEPTVGFDPKRRKAVWEYILQLRNDKTVILTTQHLDEAQKVADNIITFNKGTIIHEGDLDATIARIGYELKLELPRNDHNLEAIKQLAGQYYTESGDRIQLWVKNGKQSIRHLTELDVDLANVSIQRPMLEEVYLNLIEEHTLEKGQT